jgi:hypothetical protein
MTKHEELLALSAHIEKELERIYGKKMGFYLHTIGRRLGHAEGEGMTNIEDKRFCIEWMERVIHLMKKKHAHEVVKKANSATPADYLQ